MGDFIERLKSRKFLLALSTFAFTVVTVIFEINVSLETWAAILTPIIGYIAVEGAADYVTRKNGE